MVAVEGPEGERRWYLTTVGRHVLTAREVAEAYRLRWRVELLFKALKSGVGLTALRATRPGAVLSLVYAKVIALALSRLLELSMKQKGGGAHQHEGQQERGESRRQGTLLFGSVAGRR